MWGEGVEIVDGVKVGLMNPDSSQYLTIKKLADLDMSYQLSYSHEFDGINVSFSAKFESAADLNAEGDIPTAPVRKADRTELFKGDDSTQIPLAVSCRFQED